MSTSSRLSTSDQVSRTNSSMVGVSSYNYGHQQNSYFVYGLGAAGLFTLICSLYLFYKVSFANLADSSKSKKYFIWGAVLFILGSILLSYFSYLLGQNQIQLFGNPGFDPRTT